ncbi:MAG: GNAT family N-acetyltransferase [Phycicoccus sp.]
MQTPEVVVADHRSRSAVVDTFVSAFAADPVIRFLFPDDQTYPRLSAAYGGHLFDRRVQHDTVWTTPAGDSVAMWEAPGGADDHALPAELDPQSRRRCVAYADAVRDRLPDEPHWYLGVLATHPRSAGRRLGRAVLGPGLTTATAAGLPAALETSSEINVGVYRRAGFETVAAFSVGSLPVWVMRHPGGG